MIEKFAPAGSTSGGPYIAEETIVLDAFFRGDFPAFIEATKADTKQFWSDGAIVQINKYIELYNDQPILPPPSVEEKEEEITAQPEIDSDEL